MDLDLGEPPPAPPAAAPPPPPAPPAADPALAAAGASELRTPLQHLYAMAEKYRVDPDLALAILKRESGGRQTGPDGQVLTSSAGAQGMFQLLPRTAYDEFKLDPKDPFQNVEAGIRYLRQGIERGDGTVRSVASYYHGGPNKQLWGPVTGQYAQGVEDDLRQHLAAQPGPQPGPAPGAAPAPPPQKSAAFIGPRPPPASGGPSWESQNPVKAYLASMISGEPPPPQATPGEARVYRAGASASKFLPEATQSLNPVNIVQGVDALNTAVQKDPVGLVRSLWDANAKLRDEGRQLMDQARASHNFGQSLEGLTRIGEGMIPILGPQLARAHDFFKQGETARGAGTLTDVAGQIVGPSLISDTHVPGPFKQRLLPEQAAAVDLLQKGGVNVDLATATGSRTARNLQAAAETTLPGGLVKTVTDLGRQQSIPALAERMATQIHPVSVTPGEAGAGLRSGVEDFALSKGAEASGHYDTVERLANDPQHLQSVPTRTTNAYTSTGQLTNVPVFENVQSPVDLRAVKDAIRPIRDEIKHGMTLAKQQQSEGLLALDNVLGLRDYEPLLTTEKNLSALKRAARGADSPAFKSLDQGIAGKAVSELSQAVDDGVAQLGPQAQDALTKARAATKAKWAVEDVFSQIDKEPVAGFNAATGSGDLHADALAELARVAPQEMPKVGRALLGKIIDKASGLQQGWSRSATVANMWEQLGPKTKQILYGNRKVDLDRFFLGQRMLAERANPSGTALVAGSVASTGAILKDPFWGTIANLGAGGFALLTNTRAGVRLLTKGLTIPAGTAQAAAWSAEVAAAMRRANGNVAEPPPEVPGAEPEPPAPPWKYSTKR